MIAVSSTRVFHFFFFLAIFICIASATSTKCVIPRQQPKHGKCVNTEECPAYLSFRNNGESLSVAKISFLRQVQCPSPGQVCCPMEMNASYQNPTIAIDVTKVKVRSSLPPHTLENRFDVGSGAGSSSSPSDDSAGEGNDEECGIYTDQRIIGGEIAGLYDFPWSALLIYNSSFRYGCSGAIINKRYILTAAHCVTGRSVSKKGKLVQVRLGEYDTQGNPDCIQEEQGYDCADESQEYDIEKTIVHPYYTEGNPSQHHDIALLKTTVPITYSTFIAPICIPTKKLRSPIVPGKKMTLAGWGATDRFQSRLGNVLSPIKLVTEVPIVNQTLCQSRYASSMLMLGAGQLCAGGEKDNDSCPGDSGGPLMQFNHEANRYVSAGIVSLGKDEKGKLACGAEGFPGVYTRTDQYVDWIQNAMRYN